MKFNTFCINLCYGLYDPTVSEEQQCTGYKQLKKMVAENITPATLKDMERWETKPTTKELVSIPDIKYLRFLHPILRSYVVEHWDLISKLEV